jgi:hypothetical protein
VTLILSVREALHWLDSAETGSMNQGRPMHRTAFWRKSSARPWAAGYLKLVPANTLARMHRHLLMMPPVHESVLFSTGGGGG